MIEKTDYEILIPNNTIENKAEDALNFALRKQEIKNIAITGEYSSGKSSLIQSYFDKYIDKKDYLNISLATFEKPEKEENIIAESNSLEKIIIEKLYYSILQKYNIQENVKGAILSGFLVAFINISIYLFNVESINNNFNNCFWLTLIFTILEIICLTTIISCSISYLINLQKIKLKLGDFEVEINQDTKNEKSRNLLNDEIEFIVKILNIAKYKYIIFEDLDRFQNPKIFERLRDLNITLNSTLKQKVKFIYAIKDEMFIADNRTKFFDFIIPVVPYVSYENSGEELLKIIKKYSLENELSEDFILDVSLYISDMRILKNTVNEYIIYKKTLGKTPPSHEKLFSILLYKNTCSKDFADLQKNKGEVFQCFKNKNEKIDEFILQKENQIKEKEKEYKELEKNLISKNQFEKIAMYMIKSNINNNNNNQITLQNSKNETILIQYKMSTENILENFISDEETTIEYVYNSSWKTEKLMDFYKTNCPEFIKQYQDFKEGISTKKENINIEIRKLKEKIDESREYTLSELIQDDTKSFTVKLESYSNLVKYLLSNGYIDENYSTYISKFHEGSITEKDYNFIINLRNGKNNDYKEKLDNCLKIAKRLKNIDLKRDESLNIYLLDILLESKEYSEKRIVNLLALIKSDRYMEFLAYCICESKDFKNKKNLIINLCNLDKALLKNVKESKIEKKYRNLLLEFIIEIIDLNKLSELKYIDEIMTYVEENNLLSNAKVNNIGNKIIKFNIKFYNICNFKNNEKLYKYIIDNNMYTLNFENILEILIDNDKSIIEQNNYDCICNNKQLKQYVDDNIQYYIDNVYKTLVNKQNNSIGVIKQLLNSTKINLEGKQTIIMKETNKIDSILEIENDNLWRNIFENDLISLEWNNINSYYEKFGLDEILYNVFNDKKKRMIVLKNTIKIEDNSSYNFVVDLLLSNNLSEDAYDEVLKKSEYKLENNILSELKENRLLKLINSKKIQVNINMIDNIRNYSIEMLLSFIKNNYSSFHKEIDNGNVIFSLSEINEILKSDVTLTIKRKCFDMISDEDIENMTLELLENMALVTIENNFKEKMSEKILFELIVNIKDIDTKIKLINQNFNKITKRNIMNYLVELGENYSKIIVNRTKPKFVNNKSNRELLENIKSLGYNIRFNNVKDKDIVLSNTIR